MAEKIVREEMENAQSMDVKLDVDLNTGDSWYETKQVKKCQYWGLQEILDVEKAVYRLYL